MIIIATDHHGHIARIRVIDGSAGPRQNPHSGWWHVAGYRWIKTKQKWSTSCLLHACVSFTIEPEETR